MHEVWAVDAKEQMKLHDATGACWLTLTDEASGAILSTRAFPTRDWLDVNVGAVRDHLQSVFAEWGLPHALRFDNGHPWGTTTPIPSALALWLVGLGVEVIFGRPARSTDNAVVERSHGVLNGWVEPHQCADFEQFEDFLAYFTAFQRERYPLTGGQPRTQHYPQLRENPRRYNATEDAQNWSLQFVFDYLATFRFQRKVAVNGRVSLFSREYSLGRAYQRRTVSIQMDNHAHEWVAYDEYGNELKRFAPRDLTYETIYHFNLSRLSQKRSNPDAYD